MHRVRRSGLSRRVAPGLVVVVAACLTACGSGTSQRVESVTTTRSARTTTTEAPAPSTTRRSTTSTAVSTTRPASTLAPPAPTGPAGPAAPDVGSPAAPPPPPTPGPAPTPTAGGWAPVVSSKGRTLASQTLVNVGGASVVVVRIAASSRLHLYKGTDDGGSGSIPGDVLPHAIVAFNGAFKLSEQNPSQPSGMKLDGGTIGAFDNGMAAVVGYNDGGFGMGAWGRDVPAPGRSIAWARSNLGLLVDGGQPTSAAGNVGSWGIALSSVGDNTARSALGIDAGGNLLFAVSMATYPLPLAQALVATGAVRAMELDINPWWVCVFGFSAGQTMSLFNNPNRGANPFLSGWSRDFFVAATV